ncbi:STAS domain-containing protein [Thiohalobacter sp. IOR34]|uniref:STAS domain-containing protein n=1 Tax=Thiohalobacter sp. IOR34 TaxID=3057176 RepID=UPI0025B0ED35|nr:STAS domain-containing protein [Thiohalobacter sp. IOR34]WJW76428.1 STAS domain-containing protein [Thiohalobacter sp. IOR34]
MKVTSRLADGGKEVVIDINGRFDFSVQKEFREAYQHHDGKLNYRVNLADTEYMDSSALGMLLLLREHAGNVDHRVRLAGAKGAVRKILEVANFDKLFAMP